MATESSKKKPNQRQTGPIALLGSISACALLILGVAYVMGFVIVNGYQTRYMNYSANTLQLKHLAAGSLYTFFTFVQVVVVTFFLLSKLLDVFFPSQRKTIKKAEKSSGWRRLIDGAISIVRFIWAIGGGLALAYFLIFFFFKYAGLSSPSTTSGALSVLKAISPWMGTTLLLSLFLVLVFYKTGIKTFESALSDRSHPRASSTKQASMENEEVTPYEVNQLRRQFVEALAARMLAPVFGLAFLMFSLVSFQELYGRLGPDYGGGALHRVALHLKSSVSAPSPSGTPSSGTLSADWRESIKSKDSWLLLVDKDGAFVYVLLVDRSGNRQLLEIASGEIEAIEVLSNPPISPADARFFIQ
jgi:hypothetical protein